MLNQPAGTVGPVPPRERLLSLDVLRGLAIFGVLLSFLIWNFGQVERELRTPFDRNLELFFEFAVDSKFYTMLSFLFGLGFGMQLSRATARGESVVVTYCRRMAGLAGIGVLHGLLLRDGDILLPYAVAGFFLLAFRNASNRTLLVAAVLLVFYPTVARAVWLATGFAIPTRPDTERLSTLR